MNMLFPVIYALVVTVVLVTLAAYAVLLERKVASWIQGRVGPNRTALPIISYIPILGPLLTKLGIFQPLADGLKFLFKEDPIPGHVNKPYYILAPVIALIPALLTIIVVPFGLTWDAFGNAQPLVLANINIGILFIFAINSLAVYSVVMAGWSSNNKYSFFGGIRSSAQMISYELAMTMSVLPVLLWINSPESNGNLSLFSITQSQSSLWLILWQPLSAFIFLICLFAETNRLPFDMPESENELVGGFHTEYGSFKFGFFFLAEYIHIIVGSAVFVTLFLGGLNFLPGIPQPWPHSITGSVLATLWFLFKILCIVFFFVWVRWSIPRFRYDQVMNIGWKVLLPLSIANLIFYILFIPLIDKL